MTENVNLQQAARAHKLSSHKESDSDNYVQQK